MNKLIIVANRLPVKVVRNYESLELQPSEGGLVTGMASLKGSMEITWVGWPGIATKNEEEIKTIRKKLSQEYHPVFMSELEEKNFYEGFSNKTIWPLFHCFTECVSYQKKFWNYYKAINERFCDQVARVAQKGDTIWVQDYHLMLLPEMLRKRLPDNPIGFFLHIPFPSYELFRTLPWREELLKGMLGADLVGFHTYEYMRHFYSSVYRILGYECNLGEINTPTHTSTIDSFPMGINYQKFHDSVQDEQVIQQIEQFKERFGDFKLILSVDRLDYTKGILHRLKAFDALLSKYPNLREKVSLVMVTVPSRFKVEQYKNLKESIDEQVGKINGKYSSLAWVPIHYFYRAIPFEYLTALYNMCDIGLVTPLRDGMNLVAKEYVASKRDQRGVLILSEMAGAAIELDDALKVNPNNREDIVDKLNIALHMPEEEQRRRIRKMQKLIRRNTVDKWAAKFTNQLLQIVNEKHERFKNIINGHETMEISQSFARAQNPLIILDYDGTLVSFNDDPTLAKPDEELLEIIDDLSQKAKIVIVSGRDHSNLDRWFLNKRLDLIAEHGIWFKNGLRWFKEAEVDTNWKDEVLSILRDFSCKTPGSFIEGKASSLAFHYRKTDNFLSEMRIPQLINMLTSTCVKYQLEVLQGSKVLEIRTSGINKVTAVQKKIQQENWDFIMAIGDDKTDEDMFGILPKDAFSIKIGDAETVAKYRLQNTQKVKDLLKKLSKIPKGTNNNLFQKVLSIQ